MFLIQLGLPVPLSAAAVPKDLAFRLPSDVRYGGKAGGRGAEPTTASAVYSLLLLIISPVNWQAPDHRKVPILDYYRPNERVLRSAKANFRDCSETDPETSSRWVERSW